MNEYAHVLNSENEIVKHGVAEDNNLFETGFTATFVGYLKTVEQNVFRNANAVLSCKKHTIKSLFINTTTTFGGKILKCPKASLPSTFKNEIGKENYLSIINNRKLRVWL